MVGGTMNALKRYTIRTSLVLFAAAIWAMAGCSEAPAPLTSTASPFTGLARTPLAKPTGADVDSTITDTTKVDPTAGGTLSAGDDEVGDSEVDFPDGAVDASENVSMVKMKVNRLGMVSAELGPHGLRFKRQVWFTLSYRGADLTGVDEGKLGIFYYNDDTGVWEPIVGSIVDKVHQRVSAPLWHFSKYAIGSNG